MRVAAGSVDVSTYFVMRLVADGLEATGLTIANMDLTYVRSGLVPAAKVDATALAATNTAHTDNFGIEIDATDQPGLYRVDWPDAAFAAGVREVILSVKCATCFTEHLAVELETSVVQTGDSFARIGAAGAGLTGLATQASVDDLPTNAELATALGTADDAVLAQVALVKAKTDVIPSDPADASDVAALIAALQAFVDTEVAAIKAKTDQLTFTVAGNVDANIQRINDVALTGDGSGTPFNV